MPVEEDEFTERTKAQIVNTLETEFKSRFGNDIDLSPDSVFSTIIDSFANYVVDTHEPDLAETFDSAFLTSAEGNNLENVVEILGITRLPANVATGVARFSRSTPATTTYTVQSGTIIQTEGSNPIRFESSSSTTLHLYDDFEATSLNSEYSGDITEFGHSNVETFGGNQSLEGPSSGSHYIYRTDKNTRQGDELTIRVRASAGTDCETWFFVEDQNNHYHVTIDETGGTIELNKDVAGTESTLVSSSVTVPTGEFLEVVIDCSVPDENGATDFIVTIFEEDGTELTEMSATDASFTEGGFGFESTGSKTYWDRYSTYGTAANVEAIEGGSEGNVSSDSLVVLPVVPAGIQSVNNPHPVGDSTYVDLGGSAYVVGADEETDEELRERTRDSLGGAGKATRDAIGTAVDDLDGVTSVKVYENKEDTAVGGMSPTSYEVVVFGGDDNDIAQTIFDTAAATAHDISGVNGTAASGTAVSSVTGENVTIDFSRPTEIAIDFTIELVTNDNYIGDAEIKDLIVNYVGGTLGDGTSANGLEPEEDAIIDQIKDEVVGPDDTGVESVPTLTTSPVITQDANGTDIVAISTDEVATTDATDGSISITIL